MTSTPPTPDGSVIDRLLSEAGMEDDLDLASFLLELRTLSAGAPPTPSAGVSALMAQAVTKPRASKHLLRRRMIVIAFTVTASLGLGVSAAAAVSPQVRDAAQKALVFLVHTVAPGLSHPPTQSRIPASGSTHAPTVRPTPTTVAPGPSDIPNAIPAPLPAIPATTQPGRHERAPAIPSPLNLPVPPHALRHLSANPSPAG
jgi:hypothetical protein